MKPFITKQQLKPWAWFIGLYFAALIVVGIFDGGLHLFTNFLIQLT